MKANNIVPTRRSTRVSIHNTDWKRLREVFWSDKVFDFHVNRKQSVGNEVYLDVRSLRVNEFCNILDDNKINWKLLNEIGD